MIKKQIAEKTLQYHQSGLCCSEAIVKSITEFYAKESSTVNPKIASGFCMGIGKTGGDICGTVAGGVIALGLLFGRMNREEDNTQVIELASEYRKRFLARYGTTNCQELLKEFGEQEKMGKCKQMTADAAGMLAELLSGRI